MAGPKVKPRHQGGQECWNWEAAWRLVRDRPGEHRRPAGLNQRERCLGEGSVCAQLTR